MDYLTDLAYRNFDMTRNGMTNTEGISAPMTICIGTICDRSRKAIAISDRMVTAGDLSVAFEHDVPKTEHLFPNCVALTAGPALPHRDLFRKVSSEIHAKAMPPISEIAEKVKEKYAEMRRSRVEDEHFKIRGFTVKDFYENQRRFDPDVVARLETAIEDYIFNLHVMLLGVDPMGAHIYYIYPPGSGECFDTMGYCSMGTGDRHSDTTFVAYKYTPNFAFKKALYISYEAKKRAEIAAGVGKSTDIAIVDENGIVDVPENVIKELQNIYEKKIELATLRNTEIEKAIDSLQVE